MPSQGRDRGSPIHVRQEVHHHDPWQDRTVKLAAELLFILDRVLIRRLFSNPFLDYPALQRAQLQR